MNNDGGNIGVREGTTAAGIDIPPVVPGAPGAENANPLGSFGQPAENATVQQGTPDASLTPPQKEFRALFGGDKTVAEAPTVTGTALAEKPLAAEAPEQPAGQIISAMGEEVSTVVPQPASGEAESKGMHEVTPAEIEAAKEILKDAETNLKPGADAYTKELNIDPAVVAAKTEWNEAWTASLEGYRNYERGSEELDRDARNLLPGFYQTTLGAELFAKCRKKIDRHKTAVETFNSTHGDLYKKFQTYGTVKREAEKTLKQVKVNSIS